MDQLTSINKPKNSNNFLASIWFVLINSLIGGIYIVISVEPSTLAFWLLILCLVGFISTLISLIWYKFSIVQRFDDPKLVFRSCYKKAFLISFIPICLILIQYYFDIF